MRDLTFLAIVIGFFVLAAAYVRACELIVGRDELARDATDPDELVHR